jgi:formamidopyrimidine-DNA glycosylase
MRRLLEPAMTGARFDAVIARRPDLRGPLPRDFIARLTGTTVRAVGRRAKYLVVDVSSGETLLMHLGMSGWFTVGHSDASEPPDPHDHVVFKMSSGAIVTFNDPRRFGSMDLVAAGQLGEHPALSALGPEPLSSAFDAHALARACKGKTTSLKVALLDQRIVAGLGNIYASEALHVAKLSPLRRASTIATPSGLPRDSAHHLTAAIKKVLNEAIARAVNESYRGARFRVYDREGEPCRRPHCGGTIKRIEQAGRSTFYCPRCQR